MDYIKLKSGQFVAVDDFNSETETYIRLWLDSATQDEVMDLITSKWADNASESEVMDIIGATYATEDERREEHYRNISDDDYGM
ncbi:MAG: hypothetical protein LKF42_09835 [Streptococcaceae bacterium]|jgi:hypothetical protein|nr:hypothetical protein [Streptococcaceae bacterium]